jgi:hypothetical protein
MVLLLFEDLSTNQFRTFPLGKSPPLQHQDFLTRGGQFAGQGATTGAAAKMMTSYSWSSIIIATRKSE